MIKINSKFNILVLAVLFMGLCVVGVSAQGVSPKPVADEMFGGNSITWIMKVNYAKLVLTISRPDGTVFRQTFSAGNSPSVDISSIVGDGSMDGSFIYELRVTPVGELRGRSAESDQTLSQKTRGQQPLPNTEWFQSGAFSVSNGYIVNSSMRETLSRAAGIQDPDGPLDQVIADDLVVQGSACVGLDCVNNESFSFDTIRMKENNIRIKFDDTSSSAGFPSNDWQLTANDSASGGANKFSIEDITGSKIPFTVTAGAPTNSLFVSSTGRLGIKTATPVLDIHIDNGNTPGLRFEQDGSSGFSPQTWDVAGNEANFFIRDVTGGSRLPFRIQPGTPTNTLTLTSNGRVGVGTWSPDFPLEVETPNTTNAAIVCTRLDGAQNFMNATATFGQFGTTSAHPVRILVHAAAKFTLNEDSSITMANGASLTAGGTWTNASSRALKENIQTLTTSEAFNTLNQLNAVKYNYKVDKDEKHVGFIAEDAPDLVATKDKKGMSPMDVVAILTKVVQEQQKSLQEQHKSLQDQQQIIAELQKKISAMEKK